MVLRTLGGTTAVTKKRFTVSWNLISILEHVMLNKPSMVISAEVLGNLVQLLCRHQSALESMDSVGAVSSAVLALLSLTHEIRAWLCCLFHVRRQHLFTIHGRVLQNNKPLALVAYSIGARLVTATALFFLG